MYRAGDINDLRGFLFLNQIVNFGYPVINHFSFVESKDNFIQFVLDSEIERLLFVQGRMVLV